MVAFSEFSLDGKVALVTGSGRGLGLEIAKLLAASGARVIVNGRSIELLDRAVAVIESTGGFASSLQFDVTDETAVKLKFPRVKNLKLMP